MTINEEYNEEHITIETKDNWTLFDFEDFIHVINNIYYTLYVFNDILMKIDNGVKDKNNYIIESLKNKEISLHFCIKNKLYRISEKELLKINKIYMASPGETIFSGIAKIIYQIREIIKDIYYRNKYEKIICELKIIEEITERLKNLSFSENDLAKIKLDLNCDLTTLIKFQEKKIINILV